MRRLWMVTALALAAGLLAAHAPSAEAQQTCFGLQETGGLEGRPVPAAGSQSSARRTTT